MEFSAKQIAQFVGGEVIGDENVVVNSFSKIEQGKKGAITFLSNPKYTQFVYETEASIVLIDKNIELEKEVSCTLIRVDNAYKCVAQLLQMYQASLSRKRGIHPTAVIASTAKVDEDCYIGPYVCIGEGATIGKGTELHPHVTIGDNVKVGDNTIIYPNVTIYDGCQIGNRVILHAGVVIGADGFGFAPTENGYDKIPQIGIVVIEDDVEIGANSCVDRATFEATIVHRGTKLDNLVQIAHNVEVGENTVMSAQVGIAGSTKVGKWCMFGGQVGIAGHITIGDKVFLGAQSGVPGSLKDNQQLIGTPPMSQTSFFRSHVIFRKLPELYRDVEELKKKMDEKK